MWKCEIGMVMEEIKVKRESIERKQSREEEAMIVLSMCFLVLKEKF